MSKLQNNTSELETILQAINELPEYETYDGSYRVRPLITAQTLATNNKLMHSDLIIEEIPYSEVTNGVGGMTVTIGG